ncbi:MAG: hypothetical protein ACXVEE_35285, partial [Polyangiales bacterium]
ATLLSILSSASHAGAQTWMLGFEGGYGPRYERSSVAEDPRRGFSTHQTAHAGTIGLSFGRSFGSGALLLASARVPGVFNGEWTLGGGGGYEGRVGRGMRLGGLATVGYGGFTANSCECGRLEYSGFFARGDATFRYRFLEANLTEPRPSLSTFDVFFSAAIGATVMQARYPDMSQYGLHLDDTGLRLGPHVTVGFGFEI